MKDIDYKITLDISAAGSGCSMRLGDIDGDGRMEIILATPSVVTDARYFPHQISSITSYSVDGNLLWQVGDPENSGHDADGDLPIQIYDIDKDGKNEVIAVIAGNLARFGWQNL